MLAFNEKNIMNRLTDLKQANGLEWDKYKRSATSASCGTAEAPHLPFKLFDFQFYFVCVALPRMQVTHYSL